MSYDDDEEILYDEDEEGGDDQSKIAYGQALAVAFSNLHSALMQEMEERRKADAEWEVKAAQAHYQSPEELIDMFAAAGDPISNHEMTKRIVAAQLKQPTGRHFMDSGGIYGRHWERDVDRDFAAEPASYFRVNVGKKGEAWFEAAHNTWHWMVEKMNYEEMWTWFFHRVYVPNIEEKRGEELTWFELVDEFVDWLNANGFVAKRDGSANTYNHESMLDRVLQYEIIQVEEVPEELQEQLGTGGVLWVVQTHNGADVRGGYSMPIIYSGEEYDICHDADGVVHCTHCEAYWHTDDAYHWYFEGSSHSQLKDVTFVELTDWNISLAICCILPFFLVWLIWGRKFTYSDAKAQMVRKYPRTMRFGFVPLKWTVFGVNIPVRVWFPFAKLRMRFWMCVAAVWTFIASILTGHIYIRRIRAIVTKLTGGWRNPNHRAWMQRVDKLYAFSITGVEVAIKRSLIRLANRTGFANWWIRNIRPLRLKRQGNTKELERLLLSFEDRETYRVPEESFRYDSSLFQHPETGEWQRGIRIDGMYYEVGGDEKFTIEHEGELWRFSFLWNAHMAATLWADREDKAAWVEVVTNKPRRFNFSDSYVRSRIKLFLNRRIDAAAEAKRSFVTEDGLATCPECGKGTLGAGLY